jgi:hypothetical protein
MSDDYDDGCCDPAPDEEAAAFSASVDAVLADVDVALDSYAADPMVDSGYAGDLVETVAEPEPVVPVAASYDVVAQGNMPEPVAVAASPVELPSTDATFVPDTSDWLAPMQPSAASPAVAADTGQWVTAVDASATTAPDWSGGTGDWLGEIHGGDAAGSGGASDMMRLLTEAEAVNLNVGGMPNIHGTPTENGIVDADDTGRTSPPGIPRPQPDGYYRID